MASKKVFISWSGLSSQNVAISLHSFLTEVLTGRVKPFVSSEDIGKGARGLNVIAKELEDSMFGVVVVTHENLGSVWVNFEAGALSRVVDESYVAPLLVGITDAEVVGPLKQFQNTNALDRDAVFKLVQNINSQLGEDKLPAGPLGKLFDSEWPTLEAVIEEAAIASPAAPSDARKPEQLLEEVLTTVRGLQRTVDRIEAASTQIPSVSGYPGMEEAKQRLALVLARAGIIGRVEELASREHLRVRIREVADLPPEISAQIQSISESTGVTIRAYMDEFVRVFTAAGSSTITVKRPVRRRDDDEILAESRISTSE